eukprot:COSAG01_NODE_2976_length_6765_cov_22.300480_2_plen_116_part_00
MVLFVSKVTLLLKVVPQFLYRAGGERHLAVCRGHVRCPVGTAPLRRAHVHRQARRPRGRKLNFQISLRKMSGKMQQQFVADRSIALIQVRPQPAAALLRAHLPCCHRPPLLPQHR